MSLQKDGMHQTAQTKGLLRTAAVGIYDQYLSEKVIMGFRKKEAPYELKHTSESELQSNFRIGEGGRATVSYM